MHSKPPITAYIFDMVGVLFSLNKKLALQHIGIKATLFYCLRNKSNPFHDGMMLLNKMRLEMPGEFQDTFTYKQYLLPLSIGLWQQGIISSQTVISRIHHFFNILGANHYFLHPHDKIVLEKMLDLMIDPLLSSKLLEPIPSSIDLLKELHNRKVPLFLLSNISTDIFNGLLAKYPAIFALFTDIMTSCSSQLLKPDPAIFQLLLNRNHLNPTTTCFIDDQQENIAIARQIGLQTILCKNPEKLHKVVV